MRYTSIKRLAFDAGPYRLHQRSPNLVRDLMVNNRLDEIIVYATKDIDRRSDHNGTPYDAVTYYPVSYNPDRSVLIKKKTFLPNAERSNEVVNDSGLHALTECIGMEESAFAAWIAFQAVCGMGPDAETVVAGKLSQGATEHAGWKKPVISFRVMV
jgi:hypothetical protein